MSNVTSIAAKSRDTEADPLSAERAALEAAIEAEREARASLASIEEALRRGKSVAQSAQDKLESAKHHVEKAKEGDARRTAAAVRNRSSASPDASGVRRARESVVQAEDDLEAAQGAVARIQEDCAAAALACVSAAVDTMVARNAVLAPVCRELISRARDAHRSFALNKAMLVLLLNDPASGAPDFGDDTLAGVRAREQIAAPLAGLRDAAERATMSANRTAEEDSAVVAEAVAALKSAAAALLKDPATVLPLPT